MPRVMIWRQQMAQSDPLYRIGRSKTPERMLQVSALV
jgi:hypothetical protein